VFEVLKTEGKARRGVFTCAHGTVQTPVFMNVGTQGAIKGAVSAHDLKEIGCQVELSNTYHLHLRPGAQVVRQMGGLHRFMRWDGPILTDSGGFQVFSLSGLRKIKEEGVTFASHIDGRRIFMGPEESMQIQSNLGSDIAMAFDECVENPATYEYAKASCERTLRWLARCKAEHDRLNALPDTVNPNELVEGEAALMEFMKAEQVYDKIIQSRDFRAQIQAFLNFYVNCNQEKLEHLEDRNLGNYLIDEITRRAGNVKIEELGELTGYSVRYVNKVFKENMGISPKTYCKIARFQTVLNSLKWEEDEKDLLAIAMNAGYYDQSHMMKDFRKYTNMTPVRYIKSLEEAEYKNRLIILG